MNRSFSQLQLAIDDLVNSIHRYKLWFYLAWIDIQQRYRGSILGPLWITLSMAIFIGALSIVYSRLFHTDINALVPYLTAGMLCWIFISTNISESTDVFTNAKPLIDSIKLPYLIHVFKLVSRNVIIFFHNLLVFIIVAVIFNIPITINTLLFVPALLLASVMVASTCIMISLLGTRFRDLPPLITSLIMLVFFISPVTWQANMLGEGSLILRLNPMFYYLDLLRSPLLGAAPMESSWIVCGIITLISFIISFGLFVRFRSRIPFWI
jgi:ABC-type polysaccharide/polyol phosphate export permease